MASETIRADWKGLALRLMPLALIGVLFAACTGGSPTATSAPMPTPSPGVENDMPVDIAEVLLSGPTLSDLKPRSATLLAISDQDLVCAVAYGTTTDYGLIATDLDMGGGGHDDHHPLLTGLQPDTVYHYRLGGIGPDGTVYRSRDLTFRTPPEDTVDSQTPVGDNLALLENGARVVGTSSNFGGGDNDSTWGANNAIDGDPGTQWSSNGDGDDAWIEVRLSTRVRVTTIGFWTRTMGTSAQISSFQVVTDLGETYGPFELDDASAVHYFDVDLTAERLRFEAVDTSGGNTGAVEIEVYGNREPENMFDEPGM